MIRLTSTSKRRQRVTDPWATATQMERKAWRAWEAGGKGWAVGAKHRDEPANRIVDEAEIELELP